MIGAPPWLPPLVLLQSYGGNWEEYIEAVYAFFRHDFVDNQPLFKGYRVGLRHYPVSGGKEAAFWHLVSAGKREEERLPDLRRCERIRWPRPIIEQCERHGIKLWESERRGKRSICIWLESQDYLVVLGKRRGYVLLLTAYPVTEPHTKQRLGKEYETYKANAAC